MKLYNGDRIKQLLDKFEKKEGSRCIEGSIFFDIASWNNLKKSFGEKIGTPKTK